MHPLRWFQCVAGGLQTRMNGAHLLLVFLNETQMKVPRVGGYGFAVEVAEDERKPGVVIQNSEGVAPLLFCEVQAEELRKESSGLRNVWHAKVEVIDFHR